MSSERPATQRRFPAWLSAACLAMVAAVAFSYVLVLVRTHFSEYDDEGFMLMTLRQYLEGLPLYDRTYTEYGPFYYMLLGGVFRGVGVTHDAIRATTILFWLLVSAGWATCVWRWRRSLAWSIVTFLTTAGILRALQAEPGHPQSLVLLLYAVTFVAASFSSTSPVLAFATIGAAGAAMLLTKINVGAFLVAALVAVFVACLPPRSRPWWLAAVVRLLCTLMPAVLMRSHFGNPIAVMQCAIYTFGIWAVLDAQRRNAAPELDWPVFGWAAVGFLSVVVVTVGSAYAHGTSFTGLFEGVLMQPLRFGGAIPFQKPRHTLELYLDALFCAGGVALWVYHRFCGGLPAYFRTVAAFALILAGASIPRLATVIAPGVMWLFVPEQGRSSTSTSRVPVLLVTVAATLGILMVYPVPSTQSSIAAALVVLGALAALLYSLDEFLEAAVIRWRFVSERMLWGSILMTTLSVGAWHLTQVVNLPAQASSHLPHSRLLQLAAVDYETFSDITTRVSARCENLVTIPGMNSFNIWSDLPHPNGLIVSGAMVLFDEQTQLQLVKDFMAASRPCVIFHSGLMQTSARFRQPRPREPFLDLVHQELVRVYERNGYEIRVPRQQTSQWR